MLIRSSDVITQTVLLGVKCPFHPLIPLGESIQDVRNANDESNVITKPTVCVHSRVKIGNSIIHFHNHLRDYSYRSNETPLEVPVTRFTDSKLDNEGLLVTDLT